MAGDMIQRIFARPDDGLRGYGKRHEQIAFEMKCVVCFRRVPKGLRAMITSEVLTDYIRKALPGATVSVTDRTGTMDHLMVRVVSDRFRGRNLLDRHRMIYQALDEPMKDGRIHALEITAVTTEGS